MKMHALLLLMGATASNKWNRDTLRISLVGKTGSGKSSTGNTILGRKEFIAKADDKSVTKDCGKAVSEVGGRRVAVVDTPGLFDTSLSNKEIIRETYKSVSLLAPGPHAFLLLVPIGRFTEEENNAVKYIKAAFGEQAEKYIIVLFTRGDDLEEEGTTIEDYIKNSDPALKELISSCGNRFHVFNNREKKDRAQVKELLQKIDHMVQENGGSYYTNEMLREAEEAIEKEKERILKEKEEEIKREEEEIKRKYQEEMEKMLQMEKQIQEEEKRRIEKKVRDKEEQMKREQELQKKREEQFKERERRRKEEMEEMKRRYEEEAIQKEKRILKEMRRKEEEEMEKTLQMEKQKQEEKSQMEKQLTDKEEPTKREQELQNKEQSKERECGCEEEMEQMKRRHEEEARRQAEQSNPFLKQVLLELGKIVVKSIIDYFLNRWS